MATTIHGFPASTAIFVKPAETTRRSKRMSRHSRRALRTLAHAIEYVANQFLREPTPPGPRNARLQAVKLLMSAERQLLSECFALPTPGQRDPWPLRARDAFAAPSASVPAVPRKC